MARPPTADGELGRLVEGRWYGSHAQGTNPGTLQNLRKFRRRFAGQVLSIRRGWMTRSASPARVGRFGIRPRWIRGSRPPRRRRETIASDRLTGNCHVSGQRGPPGSSSCNRTARPALPWPDRTRGRDDVRERWRGNDAAGHRWTVASARGGPQWRTEIAALPRRPARRLFELY